MKISYFCPIWGSDEMPFEQFCDKVLEAGFDGIELSYDMGDEKQREQRVEAMKSRGIPHVGQHWQTINPDVDEHIEEYKKQLEWIIGTEPLYINSQTGRDWFSFEDNRRILAAAKALSASSGVKIIHETHRGKFSYAAAVTRRFLEADPELRINFDASHWCCVSESLLEDQQDSVELAISRADHIHARIGFQEGPQVSDPRAPEFSDALHAHLVWWDQIVERKKAANEDLIICSEFGPWPYIPSVPYTLQPLCDQWETNVHMMNLLRERYD
ncbi:sugar phosphate isomerase/epimerase [Verrucomicrobia bacterium S94]|nr:sugar phosphate isomerase/epimerase [Verrucomicrobia bacterium S94]